MVVVVEVSEQFKRLKKTTTTKPHFQMLFKKICCRRGKVNRPARTGTGSRIFLGGIWIRKPTNGLAKY